MFFCQSLLIAQPVGPEVIHGAVVFHEKGNQLLIETGNQAIINWKSFSVGQDEITQFLQSSSSSSVLNRVTSDQLSELNGLLQANGHLYLINPNGIVIGKEGQINAAAFIGSTLGVSNEEFLANQELLFSGTSKEALVNLGTIRCLEGDVFLFSHIIENHGNIETGSGNVGLVAGKEILFFPSENNQICIKVPIDSNEQLENLKNEMDPSVSIYTRAINHTGMINATSIVSEGGKVLLKAEKGQLEVSGEIYSNGGQVHLLGEDVLIKNPAIIDVSAKGHGGKICIGGDYQGNNPEIYNALYTTLYPGVSIYADSQENGNGGTVILWSNQCTRFASEVFARGGQEKGDGGFVEISGRCLDFQGKVDASASSEQGKSGQLFLDPDIITINNSGTNPAVNPGTVPPGWQFSDPPTNISINFSQLSAALSTQSVTLQANKKITLSFNGTITGVFPLIFNVGEQVLFQSGHIELDGAANGAYFLTILNENGATPPSIFPSFQMSQGTSIKITNPTPQSYLRVSYHYHPTLPFDGGYIDLQGSASHPVILDSGTSRLTLEGIGDGSHPAINLRHCQLTCLHPNLSLAISGLGGNGLLGGNIYTGISIADSSIVGNVVDLIGYGSLTPPASGTNFSGIEINGTSSSTLISGGQSLIINGQSSPTVPTGAIAHGVHIVGGQITSTLGSVNIIGTGPSSGPQLGKGVYVESGAALTMGNSATGPMVIKGESSLSNAIAIDIESNIDFFGINNSSSNLHLQSSVAGTIDINNNIKTSLGNIEVLANIEGVNLGANLTAVGGNIIIPKVLKITQPASIVINSGGGNITLDTIDGIISGNNDLQINAFLPLGTGTVALKQLVGDIVPLRNFTVSANTINIYESITTNTGDILFDGPTNLYAAGKVISTGGGLGNILFNSTLSPNGVVNPDITLNAGIGHLTFSGNVGSTANPMGLISMTSGRVHLDGSLFVNSSLKQTFPAPVEIGNSITVKSLLASSDIEFQDTVDGQIGGEALTLINENGSIIFNKAIGGSFALGTFSAKATGGNIQLNANIKTKNANMTFHDPTIISNHPTLLSGTGVGNIIFNSTINDSGASSNLTINAGAGDLFFFNNVGASVPIGSLSMEANAIYIDAVSAELRANNLTFVSPLYIGNNGAAIKATSGHIHFMEIVNGINGGELLEVNAAANLNFYSDVGRKKQLGNMTIAANEIKVLQAILTSGIFNASAANEIQLDGANIETSGQLLTLTGPVTIKDQVNLSTTVPSPGNIIFTGVINQSGSSGNLILNAGATVFFNDRIGGTNPLNTLSVKGNQINVSNNITTINAMVFDGPVQMTNPITFTSTTAGIHFKETVSGNDPLTLSATGINGSILLDGSVNLSQIGANGQALIANANNHISFQGDIITSGGTGGVFSGGNVTLTSTNGSVSVKNITTSASLAGGNAGNISLHPTAAFQLGTIGPSNTKIPNGKVILCGSLHAKKGAGGVGGTITLGPVFPYRTEGMSIATITSSESGNDVSLFGHSLFFGPYEAITVLGNLTIKMDTQMTIEDLVSLNNMNLIAPNIITRLKYPIMILSSNGSLYQADNTHILAGQTLSLSGQQSVTGIGPAPDFESLQFDSGTFETELKFNTTILGWDYYFSFPHSIVLRERFSQEELRLNNSLSSLLTSELFFEIQNYIYNNRFKRNINSWKLIDMHQ